MKKIIFLTLFTLTGMSMMAQKPVEIGIHGGWSSTKMYVTNYHTRTHWGYMAGVFGRVNFSKGLYLEPAIDYVHKEVLVERSVNDTKLRISAIDVPVLFGKSFLEFPLIKVRGFIGPVASFLYKPMPFEDRPRLDVSGTTITAERVLLYGRFGLGVDVWRATLDINYELGLNKPAPTISVPQTLNVVIGFKLF
jgi:hypothetical protein